MFRRGISFLAINALLLAASGLAFPPTATAQRHGGNGMPGSGLAGSRPDGVEVKDSLKDFHQILALQATAEQITEFQSWIKSTEAARTTLEVFQETLRNQNAAAEPAALNPAIDKARNENGKFQEGFSPAQKSGLKEIVKRLNKADANLEQEQKVFGQSLTLKLTGTELATRVETFDKALADYHDEQLALGRAMSIVLASGQDVAFTLPQLTNHVTIQGRTIAVPVAGALMQTAALNGRRTFNLGMTVELSDLQEKFLDLLRAQLETNETCGQRIAIRQASLMPAAPASLIVVRLHFERWMCTRYLGQVSANELAESDGTVEIKLAAVIENHSPDASKPDTLKPDALKLVATFGRIDATGMLDDSLRSGSLGEDLRDAVVQSVRSAILAGVDSQTALPPALQNSAAIQKAKFENTGVGGLSVVLEGQIEISNEQADQLANRLNQTLSAQGTPAQAMPAKETTLKTTPSQ
ncbi:MAG TPA: hypothetical protein VGM18_03705 [Candidatus Sulfotelmatobacter sp.]|jgi:hypothetical protein